MVSVTVQTKGKPTITLDFADKHPDKVTIADVKTAVHTKFPKASSGSSS
jgi:very-long-chain enoyl-CoA reductase